MTPATWILIALVAALVAMAVSGLGRGAPGARQFVDDLRWWRREGYPTEIAAAAEADHDSGEDEEAEEGGVEDLFDIGWRPEHAYVEPSAEFLVRVTQRAVGTVSGLVTQREVDSLSGAPR